MFPAQFKYERAEFEDQAALLLARYGGDARILAGGQSLIPAMRYRLARPAVLIDINPIRSLEYASENERYLTIGATARDALIEHDENLRYRYAMLGDASDVVADPVIRQSATIVGSLCHNDPAGDWPVVALAARAEIVIRGSDGRRVVSIDDFLVDSFATAVGEGEMALEVRFPKPAVNTSSAFFKIERKVGDFATANAAVQLTLSTDGMVESAGIAVGAVGPKAMRVAEAERILTGGKPDADRIRAAMEAAKRVADPVADNRGSAEFKREMAAVLVGRALRKTLERLGTGGAQR